MIVIRYNMPNDQTTKDLDPALPSLQSSMVPEDSYGSEAVPKMPEPILESVETPTQREAFLKDLKQTFGFIYFAECGSLDRLKIGFTTNPTHRLVGLRASYGVTRYLAVVPGSRYDEGFLHRQFADIRLGGEWFRLVPALVAEILRLSSAGLCDSPLPDPIPEPTYSDAASLGRLGGKRRAENLTSEQIRELGRAGGRPLKPSVCDKCQKPHPSARAAAACCRVAREAE